MSSHWVRRLALVLMVASVLETVVGCSEKDRSDGSLTVACAPFSSATGEETRTSHPRKPSECKFGVVLFCNACVYDGLGGLSHSVSEPCGVCVGTSF